MPDNTTTPASTEAVVRITELRILVVMVVGAIVVTGLYLGRDVLIPITLAILLSFVLAPVVELLRRLRLGRIPAVLIAILLTLGMIVLAGSLIGVQVASLARNAPAYIATVETKVDVVRNFAVAQAKVVTDGLSRGLDRNPAGGAGTPIPAGPVNEAASNQATPTIVEVRQPDSSPLQLAERILAPVLGPLATTGIVLIVAIFVLLQREDLRDRMIRLFGATDLHRTTTAMDDAGRRLSRFFLAQLTINAAFGCVIALGLFFIGVPSPLLWGVVAALMRFVPYIGAPLAYASGQGRGW